MRILHLFSMAGVAEIMCHYGAGDKVLQLEQFDTMGFGEYYGVTETFKDLQSLIKRAEDIQTSYDKIVIHDYSEFKLNFPKNKVVLIFHGSKLRSMQQTEVEAVKQYPCFVTTSDLLEKLPFATHLPAPCDRQLFKTDVEGYGWIAINRSYQRDIVEKRIREKYPDIQYYERNANSIIRYEDMPDFLSQYKDYVDWKFTTDAEPVSLPDPSCTGIQALSLGLTVHDKDGGTLSPHLLLIHDAKRVCERFIDQIT